MDLEFDSDLQSLSGVTLAEDSEVTVEHEELLGAGSNFHWRVRITPPASRRFSFNPHNRNREVIANISGRRLPYTISAFRDFIRSRCPTADGRGFELRCSVWPTSPYGIVPVRFANDLPFGPRRGSNRSDRIENSETENRRYQNLIHGCREFSTQRLSKEVEFEVKVVFTKEAAGEMR